MSVSIEFWIILLVVASAVSAWIGFTYARRGGPTQAELDALEQELDQARQQAETVQSGVNEHFEQSAVLFGNLAKDYREFLEHFSDSAQSLGLPASRARELLEQGFQPLLVHEQVSHEDEPDESVVEATPEEIPEATLDATPVATPEGTAPEPPLMEDVVAAPMPDADEPVEAATAGPDPLRTDIFVEMPGESPTEDAGSIAEDTSEVSRDLNEADSPKDSVKQQAG
jgi:uncharacterized membrane-anchored protein YhcB (DUF1043 family)